MTASTRDPQTFATVRVCAVTARGAVRAGNEDAVLALDWISQSPRARVSDLTTAWTPPLACAVADGLGGHSAGELASRLAIADLANRYIAWDGPRAVHDGVVAIGHALHYTAARQPGTAGMRTTIAGVLLTGDGAYVFNVGDSRVYRITDGYLEQLSVDDAGPGGATVTQCLGDPPDAPLVPHVAHAPLDPAGARFLLCTDGVHGQLDERRLRAICRAPDARALVENLRDEVYAAGAADNLTAVVIDVLPRG
ncbi:serine/threonine phosphatase [Micromonospora sp. ATCC 39149]|uniref:Serine/threonine-protein phosphatase n=1 Tax=Micromonospora carbonacea TaxID=47853 RepID=A0A7D5YFZ5_9ACTN|nr:PP2C family serine/threonine-protein phosphatase [Micromonospora sp. ATCC 39149]EEP70275.1 serine/threonine phosphatase [Micromonospora sp. ATCC 39149]QLJ96694.1 serine/threonine-protein phosphatase [Micromonospora carbonacea]